MRLVARMTQNPPSCLHCGSGNVEDNDHQIPRAIDLERDVNWGDSTYLCENCGLLIAGLLDCITREQYQDLERTIKSQKQQLHELKAQLQRKSRRMGAILEGKRAMKDELRERRTAKKKTVA